ncbi:MAG: thioredoxin family protein [Marinilabiliales bacterium]|nr:MAG: thioredoxin family protein [Marinilabiliales bacterium]
MNNIQTKGLLLTLIALFTLQFSYSQGYKVGDKASGFNLLNVDGNMVSDEQYADAKGFIVIFTCNHCPFSVAYEDRIIAIDKKYKKLGYPVIAINPNDSIEAPADSYSKMIIRSEEKGFTFPYLLDADQSLTKTYGATRTPHVFILKKNDNDLLVEYIGAIDDNHEDAAAVKKKFLEDAVDSLLKGDKPEVDFTKAIGCSVKFAKL